MPTLAYWPALSQEKLESIGAAWWYRKMEAIAAHTPYDSWGIHIFVGNLPCQKLPQDNSKWPDQKQKLNTNEAMPNILVT